jgi:hypothetical protein
MKQFNQILSCAYITIILVISTATGSGAPFQATQLTAALKKHSERTCSATLTVASYRQTVLAIAKQHIVPMAQPFDARKPEQISEV